MLNTWVARLETFFFGQRVLTVVFIAIFTAFMAVFALQLKMEAGFEKQMPSGHEYIETFQKYRNDLFGANRLTIVVKARNGTIFTQEGLARLYAVTQAVIYMPNVNRLGVQSLWTPNSFVNEITEEGFRADPLIPGTVTPEKLTPDMAKNIQRTTNQGGFIGTLVSRDQTSAMITADLAEADASGKKLDYVAYNQILESLRQANSPLAEVVKARDLTNALLERGD